MIDYQPLNWFWVVGGDESRVWSSAASSYLPSADASFVGWVDRGGIATRIANARELSDVLAVYDLVGPYVSTDPNDYPLRPDQFFAMLAIAGLTDAVTAAVAAIPDARQRAIAGAKLNHTDAFHRDNPLFETLKAGVGVTDAQIDAMWMQAKDL